MSNVVLVAVYTRGMGPSAYGIVEYMNVLQVLVQVVVGLELTQGIARFYGGAQSDDERRAYASTGFWFLVVAYGLVCSGLFLASDHVEAALFGGEGVPGILRPALVSVFLGIMFYAVRSQLRWELRATRYATASLIAAVTTVSLSTYLLLVVRTGVIGVFVGSAIGSAAGVVSCLYGLRSTYRWSFDFSKLKTMLGFSLPLTVSTLALFAANYGDRIIVRAAMGFDDLGVYAAGAKVASVIALASAGFQLGAAPLIYRHFRRPETPETLAQLLRLFVGAGLVGVLTLATVSVELVAVFAPPAYAEASRVVPVFSLATVLAGCYVFLPGLALRNMTSRFAAISVTTAGVSLMLVALLARLYGLVGAASGVLVGAGVGFALHAIFSQRVYPLPVQWWRVFAAVGIAVATVAISWGLGRPGPGFALARVSLFVVAASSLTMVLLTAADRTLIGRLLSSAIGSIRPRTGR